MPMTFDTALAYALVIAAALFLARPTLSALWSSSGSTDITDHPSCDTQGQVGGCGGGCSSCPIANPSTQRANSSPSS